MNLGCITFIFCNGWETLSDNLYFIMVLVVELYITYHKMNQSYQGSMLSLDLMGLVVRHVAETYCTDLCSTFSQAIKLGILTPEDMSVTGVSCCSF